MENKRRNAVDAAFRFNGIDLDVTEGNRASALKLGINESMVRHQSKDCLNAKRRQKFSEEKKYRWPELENILEDWVKYINPTQSQKPLFVVCKTFPVAYIFVEFYLYVFN